MNPDEIKEKAHALADAGASAEEIEAFVKSATQAHAQPKIGQMGIPISDESPEDASYAQKALGGIASMARDIPGVEAAQAGTRALLRGESYGQALSDIRGAEDAAPKWVRRANRVIGATVASAAAPGGAITQGATFGGLSGLLKADPDAGIKNRLGSAAVGATIGAVAPKVAQGLGTVARTVVAKPLGKVALARKAAMEAADAINYGKAVREGNVAAANPMPQVVGDAMDETDIKPYIAEVKASRTMKGANPAAIVRKAYELMTDRQNALGRQTINSGDYKAGSELEKADIAAAKRRLLDATDNIMPSFRPAVYAHATAEGQMDKLSEAADVAKNIMSGKSGKGELLDTRSPDAFMASIKDMTPEEARASLQGLLGRMKEERKLTVNPIPLFGIPRSFSKFANAIPYLEALDKQANPAGNFSELLRATGLGLAAPAMHP